MSNIVETTLTGSRLICVGFENSKNFVEKSLWLRIQEKNKIDLKFFLEKYGKLLWIKCYINNVENGIEGGRVYKNDSAGIFNIDEEVYFNTNAPKSLLPYNDETYLAIVDMAHCYKSESDCCNNFLTQANPVLSQSNPVIEETKSITTEEAKNFLDLNIQIDSTEFNPPFDYCNDYDGDEFTSEIDFIVKIVIDLYSEDPYRVKEGIRELYGIIKCRNRAREISVNEAEFNALDQAMNFFYLTHVHQKKKRDQALKIVSKHYKVSPGKIESIWNSLVNYKRHIGEAMEFKKKNYKSKS
jgi:hypothetical protein